MPHQKISQHMALALLPVPCCCRRLSPAAACCADGYWPCCPTNLLQSWAVWAVLREPLSSAAHVLIDCANMVYMVHANCSANVRVSIGLLTVVVPLTVGHVARKTCSLRESASCSLQGWCCLEWPNDLLCWEAVAAETIIDLAQT